MKIIEKRIVSHHVREIIVLYSFFFQPIVETKKCTSTRIHLHNKKMVSLNRSFPPPPQVASVSLFLVLRLDAVLVSVASTVIPFCAVYLQYVAYCSL